MNLFVIVFISIIYVLIILYIYMKYNKDEKTMQQLRYYREPIEISASEAVYLYNKKIDGINLILADILTLVNQGKIKMEVLDLDREHKEYIFYKKSDLDYTTMKNHESMSHELFFDLLEKNNVTYLSDFLDKIAKDEKCYRELEVKAMAIRQSIKYELEKEGLTDAIARIQMRKINSASIWLSIITIIMLIVTFFTKNATLITITYISMAFFLILYNTTDKEEEKITQKGADILEKTKALNRYINDYIIVEDKPIYAVNILDYYYIMAIALGLAQFGKKEFYKNSIEKAKFVKAKNSLRRNRKHYIKLIMIIAIIVFFGYWIYSILGNLSIGIIIIISIAVAVFNSQE